MTATIETEPTPAQIIAQADQEIVAAQELADELENRVRDGDDGVTYQEVERARGLKRFAQLRREAAEKKAVKLAEETAAAEFDAFLTEHLAAVEGQDEKVDKLLAQARKYVDQALQVALEHDRHVFALAERAGSAGNPYDPEANPVLIGSIRPPEYEWFQARGTRMSRMNRGGVLVRLLKPYIGDLSAYGRYSKLKDAVE